MKHFIKYPFALALLSASAMVHNTQAARYVWFDEPYFDNSWVDDLMDFQRHSFELFRQQAAYHGPSKEDREAIKAAREKLAKIKQIVTEDDQKVTIQFAGFEGLDKKDVKIVKKDHGWLGTITTKEGKVEFLIGQNGVQMARRVEINREEKDKKERISFSLPTELEYFKQLVDTRTVKAEPIKDNTLTVTVAKVQEEILPIP